MARRSDRLQLRMVEWMSDPKFIYHLATLSMPSPDGDPLLYRLAQIIEREAVGCLTTKQRQIFRCVLRGMTQQEIGRSCGIHQTSVHKALHGNLIYAGSDAGKRFGGLFWKLAKIAACNVEVRDILEQLSERNEDVLTSVRRGKSPWTKRWLWLVKHELE